MMLSVAEIEQRLRDKAESLARELLPNARQEGHYLKVGSVQGEPGGSLVIQLAGHGQGLWRDYAGTEHGDMLDLIQAVHGLADKGAAVAWAKTWLGIADDFRPGAVRHISAEDRAAAVAQARNRAAARQAKEALDRAAKIRRAKGLFLSAVPIAGTPAELYLLGRGLNQDPRSWPGALRFHEEVWNREHRVKLPAMVAAIYLADGSQVALHRTYLQQVRGRWCKLDSPNAKMVLGPMRGGFVPLNKGSSGKPMRAMPPGEPVYVTEGIEDGLVVRLKLPGARVVCAIALGNVGAIVLPEPAKNLVIVADRDENAAAQAGLERAIAVHQARGIEVGLVLPPVGIKDLNDWLLKLAHERRAG